MAIIYNGNASAVIDSPGDYTITQDLTQSNPNADCITINPGVHYVTLRLRSRLVGAGGPASNNRGIRVNGNAAVTILGDGGSIRGFTYGVEMYDANIPRISGLYVQDALFRGIKIEGRNALVEGCDIRNVTGATWTPNAFCMGIEVQGMQDDAYGRPKILRNLVESVCGVGTGEGVGISVTDMGMDGIVVGNTMRNSSPAQHSYGLWVGGQSNVLATHNAIYGWDFGAAFSSPTAGFIDENAILNCNNLLFPAGNVAIGGMDG